MKVSCVLAGASSIDEDEGAGTVSGSHVYADNGEYTIHVYVTDKDGAVGSATATATIS